MLPEEDRPPAWLGDYGSIEADIEAMEDVARSLARTVQNEYAPHLEQVTASMMTELPGANPLFPELAGFLNTHHDVQQTTFANTFNFRDGTGDFAEAATTISRQYRSTDAFSQARVRDVERAFDQADIALLDQSASTEELP